MKHICFLFGVKINIYVYLLDRSWDLSKHQVTHPYLLL
jgi:hypothetical protein